MQYVMVPDEQLEKLDKESVEYIERETDSKIVIDHNDKTIGIKDGDSVNRMTTKNVMKAIAVGFNVHDAVKLSYNTTYHIEILNIKEMTRNKSEMKRQKGRVIGKDGRTRELIEELTDTDISIYKRKIGIIGKNQDVLKARESIRKIISGKPHPKVYSDLEEYKREKNQQIPSNFR